MRARIRREGEDFAGLADSRKQPEVDPDQSNVEAAWSTTLSNCGGFYGLGSHCPPTSPRGEAQRLGDFVKALVIEEPDPKPSTLEIEPSVTTPTASKRSRVGLGPSNKPPRGRCRSRTAHRRREGWRTSWKRAPFRRLQSPIVWSGRPNNGHLPADTSAELTIGPVLDDPGLQDLFALLDGVPIPDDKTETVQDAVWEITDGDGLTPESRIELQSLRGS
jgi:hypothetical protein